jgi:magnesium transporter
LSRYAERFMKKIKPNLVWQDKMTMLLWRILDENNSKNFDHLREIEEHADHLVKDLMDPKTPRNIIGPYIYKMKHALIVYLDALWATLDVINTLRYGDAETLTDDKELLERITALSNNVTTQISLSEHMSEVLASGLEVLQSIYNNQLQIMNNRLALVVSWLTVLGTAVLVPNTLATIFGTPAFADSMDATTMIVILLIATVIATAGAYWFIKKRGWIPTCVE